MEKLIIKTTDVYEIVWYLCASDSICIESVEVLPRGKIMICQFALSGDDLDALQNQYLQDQACINIKNFRKTLHQVNALIEKARKQAKQTVLSSDTAAGGAV